MALDNCWGAIPSQHFFWRLVEAAVAQLRHRLKRQRSRVRRRPVRVRRSHAPQSNRKRSGPSSRRNGSCAEYKITSFTLAMVFGAFQSR